jgi:hypothetical protein
MNRRIAALLALIALAIALQPGSGRYCSAATSAQAGDTISHVIHISVDGLRPDAVEILGPEYLPNFYRMRIEGSFADNARTDYDYTVTLPNHACILTGRPVLGPDGHGVYFNNDPGGTFEDSVGTYVAGVFDVVHDNGFSTAFYASKSKFDFFERSWDAVNGAPDLTGEDNGRGKIDIYVNTTDTSDLIDSFIVNMSVQRDTYSFIHLYDPDDTGHSAGWNSPGYFAAVIHVDSLLGRIFDLVDNDHGLSGRTALIVTADHGGIDYGHSNATIPENYTIPFYTWGPGIPAQGELYDLNWDSRLDPGTGRPDYSVVPQPIRNGGSSNLALHLLQLSAIPGSVINSSQDLIAHPANGLPTVVITEPADGAEFHPSDTVRIVASASTDIGSIVRVEFFVDWARLGMDTTSPYEFNWCDLPLGVFRLTAVAVRDDEIASSTCIDIQVTSLTDAEDRICHRLDPACVYPNPFTGSTSISFFLGREEVVELSVYDVLGRKIETVYSGRRGPGGHTLDYHAKALTPGIYFYLLRRGNEVSGGKLLLLK